MHAPVLWSGCLRRSEKSNLRPDFRRNLLLFAELWIEGLVLRRRERSGTGKPRRGHWERLGCSLERTFFLATLCTEPRLRLTASKYCALVAHPCFTPCAGVAHAAPSCSLTWAEAFPLTFFSSFCSMSSCHLVNRSACSCRAASNSVALDLICVATLVPTAVFCGEKWSGVQIT